MFDLTRAAYYADFMLAPVAMALIAWDELARGFTLHWLALIVVGLFVWSFAEYWIHRLGFHGSGPFADEHDRHHVAPAAYIGVSPVWTLMFGLVLYFWLIVALGLGDGGGMMIGIVAGYWLYIALHDRFHHGRVSPRSMLYAQMRRHDMHHAGIDANYGVSSPLFDVIFRSYRPLYRPERARR